MTTATRSIYCCACTRDVEARLTVGAEVYPSTKSKDFAAIPFWICDTCRNFVGCHHKSNMPIEPLGSIPTPRLKLARQHIHANLDPIWQSGAIDRTALYMRISNELGYTYHTGEIRTIEEARRVYRIVLRLAQEFEDTF